jgi:putative flippase GtrA
VNRFPGLIRWVKFNAVGALGIFVQLMMLAILKGGLGLNYLGATALAVETTVLHNFVWHQRFTWSNRPSSFWLGRLAKFNLTNGAISILGNLAAMRVLAGSLGLNYFVANLLSIAICSLVNFLVSDWFVFTKATDRSRAAT